MGITDLLDTHFLKNLAGVLLQFSNLDGTTFQPVRIACGGAELADGTETATAEAKRIISKNGLSSAIVILILNLIDEGADVNAY